MCLRRSVLALHCHGPLCFAAVVQAAEAFTHASTLAALACAAVACRVLPPKLNGVVQVHAVGSHRLPMQLSLKSIFDHLTNRCSCLNLLIWLCCQVLPRRRHHPSCRIQNEPSLSANVDRYSMTCAAADGGGAQGAAAGAAARGSQGACGAAGGLRGAQA